MQCRFHLDFPLLILLFFARTDYRGLLKSEQAPVITWWASSTAICPKWFNCLVFLVLHLP
jgi:hypothetical protein